MTRNELSQAIPPAYTEYIGGQLLEAVPGCGVNADNPTYVKPRLLDLFCGAGGAAVGYARAGFEVVGVDIKPQPHYPFEFHQGDALAFVSGWNLEWVTEYFDAIHASPPCQAYSAANHIHQRTDHPDLIGRVRELLRATGLPWVIENVQGAPLMPSVVLCGSMFGLNVRRHRVFESNRLLLQPPCGHHDYEYLMVFGGGARRRAHQIGRTDKNGPMLRRGTATVAESRAAMGIDWMTRDELCQAIPPAYTEMIGHQLLEAVMAA